MATPALPATAWLGDAGSGRDFCCKPRANGLEHLEHIEKGAQWAQKVTQWAPAGPRATGWEGPKKGPMLLVAICGLFRLLQGLSGAQTSDTG